MKLDSTTVGQLYDRCHFTRPQGLSLFAVRGALVASGQVQLNPDAYNLWNDTIGLIDFRTGDVFGTWDATAGQPGTYWTKHDDYAGADSGAPFTMPCGGIKLKTGIHRNQWWCLVQCDGVAGAYPAVRDMDQDEVLEARDKFCWTTRENGINVHWEERVTQRVEYASSGCHVMKCAYNSKERALFKATVEKYEKAGQTVFPYAVFEGSWLVDGRDRLLYGSVGDDVKWFQELLNKEGYPVKVDGQFGQLTHDRAVQRNRAKFKAGVDVTKRVDQWGVAIVPEQAAANPYQLDLSIAGATHKLPFAMPDGKTAMVGVRELVDAFGGKLDTEAWPQLSAKIGG